MNRIIVSVFFVLLLFISGCFSMGYRGVIQNEITFLKETKYQENISSELSPTFPLIIGSYLGKFDYKNAPNYKYQFEGILDGSSKRVLEILIPEEEGNNATLCETTKYERGIEPAYLVFLTAFNANNQEVINTNEPQHFISLKKNIRGEFYLSFSYLNPGTKDVREKIYPVDENLNYIKRSRLLCYTLMVGYLGTSILDIATSPIQIIYAVLKFH